MEDAPGTTRPYRTGEHINLDSPEASRVCPADAETTKLVTVDDNLAGDVKIDSA